jgi:hypothetical protein
MEATKKDKKFKQKITNKKIGTRLQHQIPERQKFIESTHILGYIELPLLTNR